MAAWWRFRGALSGRGSAQHEPGRVEAQRVGRRGPVLEPRRDDREQLDRVEVGGRGDARIWIAVARDLAHRFGSNPLRCPAGKADILVATRVLPPKRR